MEIEKYDSVIFLGGHSYYKKLESVCRAFEPSPTESFSSPIYWAANEIIEKRAWKS